MSKIQKYKDNKAGKKTAIGALEAQVLTLQAELELAKTAAVKQT